MFMLNMDWNMLSVVDSSVLPKESIAINYYRFIAFLLFVKGKKIIIHSSKRLVRALWHGLGETKT